jgi:hypothetical protein
VGHKEHLGDPPHAHLHHLHARYGSVLLDGYGHRHTRAGLASPLGIFWSSQQQRSTGTRRRNVWCWGGSLVSVARPVAVARNGKGGTGDPAGPCARRRGGFKAGEREGGSTAVTGTGSATNVPETRETASAPHGRLLPRPRPPWWSVRKRFLEEGSASY